MRVREQFQWFAKMLQRGREVKVRKDRAQALVSCAVLGDLHPGALQSAVKDLPRRALKHQLILSTAI
jgi:hypothetical protein